MGKFKIILIAATLWMLCSSNGIKGQDLTEILLYPDDPEFKPENRKEEKNFDADGLRNIFGEVVPRMFVYKSEKACGTGIIICPGGGYSKCHVRNTRFIAERLNRMGVTVFVLIYRLPAYDPEAKNLDAPLQDVQTAFRLIRSRAGEWGLDKNKIGIWGNSAGGHLAAMAATHYTTSYIPGTDTTGVRPDFLVLAWSGGSSRLRAQREPAKELFGGDPTEERIHYYSPDECVNSRTPATFIVHANDDPIVNPENSVLFYEALKKSNVPVELHIYEKGGHGFGIDPDVKNEDSWITQLEIWLRNRGLL